MACYCSKYIDEDEARRAVSRERDGYQVTDEMFRVESWMQVKLGKRLMPRGYHHIGRMLGPERLRRARDKLRGSIAGAVTKMPMHWEFLGACCLAPEIFGSR